MAIESIGVGVDTESTSRMEELWKAFHPFIERTFTPAELAMMPNGKEVEWLTGRFCAKEAISKALMDLGEPSPDIRRIEVLAMADGCPKARLLDGREGLTINVSISHGEVSAIAFAVVRRV
jgi:phosphopantetheine--protein transferase-like protein